MKKYIFILTILYSATVYTQEYNKSDFDLRKFTRFPAKYTLQDRAYLIDKIQPDSSYKYWECIFKSLDFVNDFNRGNIIVYNGDSINYVKLASQYSSNNGFFNECRPGFCFTYIVAVRDSNNVEIIENEFKLTKFIGKIDNIEEVILTAKIKGFWFDEDSKIGGAYRERANDYLLYLLEWSSTPVTYKSVKAILTKSGEFKVISKKIYKQTDDYIIE